MSKKNNLKLSIGATTLFKLFLLIGIVAISLVFIWYTLDVIGQLKAEAERTANSYVRLWQMAANENTSGSGVQIIFEEVIEKANFPVIIADPDGEPIFWRNIENIIDNDPSPEALSKVRKIAQEMQHDKDRIALYFEDKVISYFYYGDSKVIRQLQYMPFVEIGLVGAFILIGFIGFQNIRRSEERHIWVGMAKETAHQLGTPISSLLGWLEIGIEQCKTKNADGMSPEDVFEQMKVDIIRLRRVANRFGQIGSQPEWKEVNIDSLLEESVAYYRHRLPFNGKGIEIGYVGSNLPSVPINGELFTWVIENLIKNAMQSVNPNSGRINLSAYQTEDCRCIIIDVKDNGVGIPTGIARKIFRPGFTTKKRGWGLGLTLARRIVEEYHRGKIALVRSKPGETLFRIVLPIKGAGHVKRFGQYM